MSDATITKARPESASRVVADSFSKSVVLIAGLMIVQRGIGFLRSFYVCGTLTPAEVGQWDLAFSFLVLAAPLAVLGIPGSFGRYVARFEQTGDQGRLLRQTLCVCSILVLLSAIVIHQSRFWVAEFFFGSRNDADLVGRLAIGMPVIAFFNFATSWFTGKRLNRFVFRIQFTQTVFFAVLCVVAFRLASVSADSVVAAYVGSCLAGLMLAASYAFVDRGQKQSPAAVVSETGGHPIWPKLLPFAIWVWVSNALTNLFSVCDRLLLVNHFPDPSADIQQLIGQYHTACIFPLLLVTIGAMAASTGLPYLSKDWEQGRRGDVNRRVNLMMKVIGLVCMAASVGILVVAPVLFGSIWNDKFALGESLLPMTLCYCSLAALATVAQQYFWCIEKTWVGGCLLAVGLLTNYCVGRLLIWDYGILGVVASTLVAHALVLCGIVVIGRFYGFRIDRGVVLVSIAMLSICFGPIVSVLTLSALVILSWYTALVLDDSVRQPIRELIGRQLARYKS